MTGAVSQMMYHGDIAKMMCHQDIAPHFLLPECRCVSFEQDAGEHRAICKGEVVFASGVTRMCCRHTIVEQPTEGNTLLYTMRSAVSRSAGVGVLSSVNSKHHE